MEKRELKAFVPKFDKIPWLSEASLVNKPLVLSIPRRYHSSIVLPSYKKDVYLPHVLEDPDVILKVRKNERENLSPRNKQLCSTCRGCQEVRTVQPKIFIIPDHQKLSFQNSLNHREASLHSQVQQLHSCNDIPTESIRYRLPILGPRTAVFHRLLSGAYESPQDTQHCAFPRKKGMSKTVKQ
ncbi:uncharacterized protein C1orf105 homolog [Arvicanthis niloticus]|uniref:uncharacterized protein C1orf105 homolog n=1 Tax=Arvicanthis niloticus TaxID=61156 RepID=UPI001486A8FD|nr:uncharacterized protein C1orf105 homolog isoform X2 [Arvicanthis niloticus]